VPYKFEAKNYEQSYQDQMTAPGPRKWPWYLAYAFFIGLGMLALFYTDELVPLLPWRWH